MILGRESTELVRHYKGSMVLERLGNTVVDACNSCPLFMFV